MKLYDIGFEVKKTYVPSTSENIPYFGLEHIQPQSLKYTNVGSSLDVKSSKFKFLKGDILFGTLRPYFKKLIIAPFDGVCSTEFCVIRPKNENDRQFLFYTIAQDTFIEYATTNSNGARPRTKWDLFSNFEIATLKDTTRKEIGSILSAYDDLIENNNRRITLLEQAARHLYKEWFVRFKFPGHEKVKIVDGVPEGWERRKLGEVVKPIRRLKKIQKKEYKGANEAIYPCVDQSQEYIGGYTNDKEAIYFDKIPLVIFGDHTRVIKYVDFPFACGADGTQILNSVYNRITPQFLYYLVSEIDLSNYFYARHFKFLKVSDILIPSKSLVDRFTLFALDCLSQISNLRQLNRKFTQARDLLLPRLMNKELSV